jgi:uncharacterized SAM-binding protein YcdF (DUF218 family)
MTLKHADYILGLGSYDLRVADRCAELYLEKWAPYIIFSGHLGNWTKNIFDKSEAEIFKERAISKGVPSDKIIIEQYSTNIGENIAYTKKIIEQRQTMAQNIIIVTKPNTERRAFATCKKIWPEIEVIITSPQINFLNQSVEYISQEHLINEMVGDIQRIKFYPIFGYQISQEIPPDIWEIYQKLVSLGYNQHLIK